MNTPQISRPPFRVLSWALSILLFASSLRAATYPVEEATVEQLQAAYRTGRTTAVEVVEACLARIAAYDKTGPYLNAIIALNPDALAVARAQDEHLARTGELVGPLHGIPVVLKDNLDAVGMTMTSGFQGWKNYRPPTDAPLVAGIRAAGGIVIAKTSLSEFAKGGADNINSVLMGFARNPYNPAYATGGSSGGTGAALGASYAVLGVGTDTGGSVRMPSAHQALAGLRPTVGLVSRTGVVPLDGVRDTAGPMARSVHDMALMLDAMVTGQDPNDPATARNAGHIPTSYLPALKNDALKGVKLGVLRQIFTPDVTDPQVLANFERTLVELRAAGAELVDPFIVPELDTLPRPPQTGAQFKADLTRWISQHPGVPFPSIKAIAESGLLHPLHQASVDDAVDALPPEQNPATVQGRAVEEQFRVAFRREMDAAGVGALVFPTWAQLPVLNGDRNTQMGTEPVPLPGRGVARSRASLTFVGSMLQWPALSVPNGFSAEGLPLGLQILGRAWDEARIIGYAYAYEQATHHRQPPAFTPPLPASFKQQFIGTWKLVGIAERDVATDVETPMDRGPEAGQLVYAANGRLSVQIVRTGRDATTGVASADGFSSYFGRWELDPAAGHVLHISEGNLNQARVGDAAPRTYRFDAAGRLSLATPPRLREDGRTTCSVFIWEKLP